MDQLVDQQAPAAPAQRHPRHLRLLAMIAAPAVLLTALGLGFIAGQSQWPLPAWAPGPVAVLLGGPVSSASDETPLYYQDPDRRPIYSAEPQSTPEGRAYVPVQRGSDYAFGPTPKAAAATAAEDQSGRKVLYYRNPMGLPDTSPVPKKDSMGMDYLPVYEGEGDGTTVTLSPGRLQRTGVRTEVVQQRPLVRVVRAPATLQLDERLIAVVSTRSDAFIEKVENITTGDFVRKGQPLLRFYSPEIAAAGAQYLSVLNEAGSAAGARPLLLEGARRRLQNLNVSAEAIAEIERTRKLPPFVTWTAPRNGVVLERNVVEGMKAAAGDVLFRIADISTVWALADVPEHEMERLKPGQSVTVRVRAAKSRSFSGAIDRIYPRLNAETRTARVRVELSNSDGVLLPDMYADVEIATGPKEPVTSVPDAAVIDTGDRQVVIVAQGEGRFEPREVKLGGSGSGFVEVREGLDAGERIVTSANFLIDAESNLKAALQGMSAAPGGEKER